MLRAVLHKCISTSHEANQVIKKREKSTFFGVVKENLELYQPQKPFSAEKVTH